MSERKVTVAMKALDVEVSESCREYFALIAEGNELEREIDAAMVRAYVAKVDHKIIYGPAHEATIRAIAARMKP